MNNLLNFLLQVSALLLILYLPYQLIFRKETRFGLNRSYLLFVLIISWIIPMLNIPVGGTSSVFQLLQLSPGPAGQVAAGELPSGVLQGPDSFQPGEESGFFNWLNLYWMGVAFMLIRNLWVIARILKLSHRSEQYRHGRYRIYTGEDLPAFTFFNQIFLNRAEFDQANESPVLKHESAHARQLHTLDLILAEMVHTVLWFNPVLILYKKALKETHEYMADRAVMNEGVDFQHYAVLLHAEIVQSRYRNLVSHFKGSTLKNRIMMAAKPSDPKSIRKYLLIIPILIGCLGLWSFIQDPLSFNYSKGPGRNLVVMIDPGHGGRDPGGVNLKNPEIREKDFSLALAKLLNEVPHPGIDFVFTRLTDEYQTLGKRVKLAEQYKADLYISLHMNTNRNAKIQGPDFYYSTKNKYAELSREICRKMGTELKARKHLHPDNEPYGTANQAVLSGTSCPSIYFGFGYITNDEDARIFSVPGNQASLAKQVIAVLQEIKKEGVLPVK